MQAGKHPQAIATKVLPPRGVGLIERPRLLELVTQVQTKRLSVIKAPAGFGKTSLAVAWASEGIRVNAIAPGWIATDLTRNLVSDKARSAQILERTPQKRWGDPADIAGVVVFLCSDAARFITGAILPIDGGYAVA